MDARGKAEKDRFRRYAPELELLLWAVWGPIGAGVPLDEYANYVPGIWRLLEEQAAPESVSAELKRICDDAIGMDAGTNNRTAELLTAWWYWRFIFPVEFAAHSSELLNRATALTHEPRGVSETTSEYELLTYC